jgi:hypothetical protein
VDACPDPYQTVRPVNETEISVSRMKKAVLLNFAALTSVSLFVTLSVYFVNILLLPCNEWVSPTDALFVEGAVSILVGFLLLLGRGGINFWSKTAAILAAAASAVSGSETVGPGEIMRRDAWRARGFLRLGLILLLAGFFMLAAYFLTL